MSKHSNLMRECDALWQILILRMYRYCCAVSGQTATVAHHIVGRSNMALRYEVLNGLPLSHSTHLGVMHGDPKKGKDWLQTFRGYQMAWLNEHKNDRIPCSLNLYLLDQRAKLRAMLEAVGP